MEPIKRDTRTLADRLNNDFADLNLNERIDRIAGLAYRAVFTSNFCSADQVLSWAIALSGQKIELTTLLTGQQLAANQSLLQITQDRYGITIGRFEEPNKALKGADVRIKARHAGDFGHLNPAEFAQWDSQSGLLILNPLADWSGQHVQQAIAAHEIPVNPSYSSDPPKRLGKPCEDGRGNSWRTRPNLSSKQVAQESRKKRAAMQLNA